jgi:putative hydrolase of the HAD superfamily
VFGTKPRFDLIAFDADDTLWSNESLYRGTEAKFVSLLAVYGVTTVDPVMHDNEVDNLRYYGYGIKGFVLSLIESAIQLTHGDISAADVQHIIDWGREMQTAPVQLMEHAQETVASLAAEYPLALITKGDLFDQEGKLQRSGLGAYFRYVEVVTDKTQESYASILVRYHLAAPRFLMVGNSLRSDILPVLALGGQAIYIPSRMMWAHEAVAELPADCKQYLEIEHLGQLSEAVRRLEQTT